MLTLIMCLLQYNSRPLNAQLDFQPLKFMYFRSEKHLYFHTPPLLVDVQPLKLLISYSTALFNVNIAFFQHVQHARHEILFMYMHVSLSGFSVNQISLIFVEHTAHFQRCSSCFASVLGKEFLEKDDASPCDLGY